MKKIILSSLIACITLLTASCNDGELPEPVSGVPAAFTYNVSYAVPQEVLDAADVTLHYTDENGLAKTEAVTIAGEFGKEPIKEGEPELYNVIKKPSISKTIKAARIPYTGGSTLSFKVKTNAAEKAYDVLILAKFSYIYQPKAEVHSEIKSPFILGEAQPAGATLAEFIGSLNVCGAEDLNIGYDVRFTEVQLKYRVIK